MKLFSRFATITSLVMAFTVQATAAEKPEVVVQGWYHLVLELIRHTPTYTPPVASRALGYLGVTAFEATASGDAKLQSLAGQLTDLTPTPAREAGATYDEAIVLDAALVAATHDYFENTGPTGQRAIMAMEKKSAAAAIEGVPADVVARSQAYGKAIAAHIFDWSQSDGGAKIENMGFPLKYDLKKGPGLWVPTNPIALQQLPLLPDWGNNRPFAMPKGAMCDLAPPVEYSEDKASEFYKQAVEVVDIKKNLTDEQRGIARFWADDAMLTTTPPGHWISIALQIMARDNRSVGDQTDLLARLGVAQADAFIGCWHVKYQYNVIRPISYIRKVMDPKWDPMLNTPPFPEYPSGHSTQSGAASTVMTAFFGDNFAFEDSTYIKDGVKARKFPSFYAAADEAALSRIYGGIHFRAAVENGQVQGKCIGKYAANLKTRK
jgi:PAP2 superfamily